MHQNPAPTPRSTPQRRTRFAAGAGAAALALLLSACGGGEEATEESVRELLTTQLIDEVELSEADASCIVDGAFERHDLDQLATFADDNPDPAVIESVTDLTFDCLLNGDAIDEIIDDAVDDLSLDEDAADGTIEPETPDEEPVGEEEPVVEEEPEIDDQALLFESSPAFCQASMDVFVTILAGDELPTVPAPATVEALWTTLIDRAQIAIDAAPNDMLAEQPVQFLASVQNLAAASAAVGHDISQLNNDPSLDGDVETLTEITDALEGYLEQVCFVDPDILTDDAVTLASQLEELAGPVEPETPDTPDPVGGTQTINDPVTNIRVTVPDAWTQTDGVASDGVRILTVAPDLATFDGSWLIDGVMITAVDVSGDLDFTAALEQTAAYTGCEWADAEPYDDGVYTGMLHRFEECAGTTTQAVVIVATDSDLSTQILVEVQMVEWSEAVLDDITASFLV